MIKIIGLIMIVGGGVAGWIGYNNLTGTSEDDYTVLIVGVGCSLLGIVLGLGWKNTKKIIKVLTDLGGNTPRPKL